MTGRRREAADHRQTSAPLPPPHRLPTRTLFLTHVVESPYESQMFEMFDLGSSASISSPALDRPQPLGVFSVLLSTNQAQVFSHHREVILSQRRLNLLLRWTAVRRLTVPRENPLSLFPTSSVSSSAQQLIQMCQIPPPEKKFDAMTQRGKGTSYSPLSFVIPLLTSGGSAASA